MVAQVSQGRLLAHYTSPALSDSNFSVQLALDFSFHPEKS